MTEDAYRFLGDADLDLAETLDVETALERLARAALSRLADFCGVDLADQTGGKRRVISLHRDSVKGELLREYAQWYAPGPTNERSPAAVALRTGGPVLVPELDDAGILEIAHDARHADLIRATGPWSVVAVPLVARGRTLGAITFGLTEGGRRYGAGDVSLVVTFARWAAIAIDNAQLFREAARAQARAEEQAAALAASNQELNDALSLLEESRSALESSEERHRLMFDANPMAMWLYDPATLRFLMVNAAAIEEYGYSRDEFLRMSVTDIRPPEDVAKLRLAVAQTVPDGLKRSRGWRHRRKDGSLLDVEITSHRLALNGREVELVLVTDVTERRRADAALREHIDKLRAVVDDSPTAKIAADLGSIITMWNPAAERLLGWTAGEMVGTSLERIIPADLASEEQAPGGAVLEGTASHVDTVRLRKDGSRADVAVSSAALHDAAGNVRGLVIEMVDIAERKRLETQLVQSQRMEAVGRLAGGIAHDFNNLLTVISSYAAFVAEGLPADDPLRPDVDEIEKAAHRAAELTRQLLAFSRKQVLQARVVGLNELVTDLQRMLQRLIGEHIELVTRLRSEVGQVFADPGQIEQVLINLVVNARDAMPDGGRLVIETANVELGEEFAGRFIDARAGPYVMLAVSDSGTGMSTATQARIFEPFFTTKDAGKGTGLGLSTVYGIVKQSGGSVWVYSEPGLGSTLKVYLPRYFAGPEEHSQPASSQVRKPRGGVVLVVEDEASLRSVVTRVLRGHSFTVLEGGNGDEALEILRNRSAPVDLLISDMVMPSRGGRSLALEVAAKYPSTKIILMSGYTEEMISGSATLPEGTKFMEKPFTPEGLLAIVENTLGGE